MTVEISERYAQRVRVRGVAVEAVVAEILAREFPALPTGGLEALEGSWEERWEAALAHSRRVSDELWEGTFAEVERAGKGLPVPAPYRYTTADFYEEAESDECIDKGAGR